MADQLTDKQREDAAGLLRRTQGWGIQLCRSYLAQWPDQEVALLLIAETYYGPSCGPAVTGLVGAFDSRRRKRLIEETRDAEQKAAGDAVRNERGRDAPDESPAAEHNREDPHAENGGDLEDAEIGGVDVAHFPPVAEAAVDVETGDVETGDGTQ